MKINKFAILGVLALGLCASASAQTDYTPFSVNLSGTGSKTVTVPATTTVTRVTVNGRTAFQSVYHAAYTTTVPTTLSVNNAVILSKIATQLNVSLAGDSLAVDNSDGHLCVLNSAGALVYDLTAGVITPTPDTNGVSYRVYAGTINARNNATAVITKGTSGLTNENFNVSGSIAIGGFTITFDNNYYYGIFGWDGPDAEFGINGGVGTFTESLTGTQTYKQSLNVQVFGYADDKVKQVYAALTGTLTANGGSTLQPVPSIWDVVNPNPGS